MHPNIDANYLQRVPKAYTARNIPGHSMEGICLNVSPKPGDLVLARVEKLGQHKTLHLVDGRRRTLFEGDELIAVYGNRYAPDQFEAEVPDSLDACHLVASGGVIARALSWHNRMSGPTRVRPIGLIAQMRDSRIVNVADGAEPFESPQGPVATPVIAIAGTAMNAGKTTTAAYLTRGMRLAGLRVGYAKVTGTGAGGDPWLIRDAGACPVLDFTDIGHVSTYRIELEQVETICRRLIHRLQIAGVDLIILEIADGLFQRETAHLLSTQMSKDCFDGILFAATDSMGASAGVQWLAREGHRIIAVTGTVTSSPLQREEVIQATGHSVIGTFQLAQLNSALDILKQLRSAK